MDILLSVLGLLGSLFLFLRLRVLQKSTSQSGPLSISVIIPARDEAANLPLLLGDLARQTLPAAEIICVDDDSSDATPQLAREAGASVITLRNKPDGWTGKSYACQTGAQAAQNGHLLFLDADVRLAPGALQSLAEAYRQAGCTLSVQPYHTAVRWHEQLSLFFNLIVAASLGARLPFGLKTKGLFGPVILISAQDYHKAGGHAGVKKEVLEDIGLGRALDAQNLPYRCCLGGDEIAFRMYAQGLRPLQEGWTKNFASGAFQACWLFIVFISLWMGALWIIPSRLLVFSLGGQWPSALVYSLLYLAMVAVLLFGGARVGRFKTAAIVFYPVCLVFFMLVFLLSLYKKIFRRPVRWKGRDIQGGT